MVGAPGGERRISNVAPGISPTDAATVGQLSSSASGLQSQINENDRRLRDGVAVAMAAGGVPAVPQGRKVGLFGNIATYDGHGAAGLGITGVVYETRGYQLQANGAVGVGFDTSVVGPAAGRPVLVSLPAKEAYPRARPPRRKPLRCRRGGECWICLRNPVWWYRTLGLA